MNKTIKLKIGIIIKFKNITKNYWERMKSEFDFITLKNNNINVDCIVNFKNSLKIDKKSLKIFRQPVAIDNKSVFFFDKKNSITRIYFNTNKNHIIDLDVSNDFDEHFFYILILYCISINYIKKDGIFIHSSCVTSKNELLLFPAWRNTGKTHLGLEYVKRGYKLISDDGVWIDSLKNLNFVSKNIHLLHYNFELMKNLQKKLDKKNKILFNLIKKLETDNFLITKKADNYLKSKVRVRIKNKSINKKNKYIVSNKTKIIFLNREINKVLKKNKFTSMNKKNLYNKILASCRFEFGYLFDAYYLWKINTGYSNKYLDNYDEIYLDILKKIFSSSNKIHQYTFTKYPLIRECQI